MAIASRNAYSPKANFSFSDIEEQQTQQAFKIRVHFKRHTYSRGSNCGKLSNSEPFAINSRPRPRRRPRPNTSVGSTRGTSGIRQHCYSGPANRSLKMSFFGPFNECAQSMLGTTCRPCLQLRPATATGSSERKWQTSARQSCDRPFKDHIVLNKGGGALQKRLHLPQNENLLISGSTDKRTYHQLSYLTRSTAARNRRVIDFNKTFQCKRYACNIYGFLPTRKKLVLTQRVNIPLRSSKPLPTRPQRLPDEHLASLLYECRLRSRQFHALTLSYQARGRHRQLCLL